MNLYLFLTYLVKFVHQTFVIYYFAVELLLLLICTYIIQIKICGFKHQYHQNKEFYISSYHIDSFIFCHSLRDIFILSKQHPRRVFPCTAPACAEKFDQKNVQLLESCRFGGTEKMNCSFGTQLHTFFCTHNKPKSDFDDVLTSGKRDVILNNVNSGKFKVEMKFMNERQIHLNQKIRDGLTVKYTRNFTSVLVLI